MDKIDEHFRHYLPMQSVVLYQSLKLVNQYLDDCNLEQGYNKSARDYCIDMYPKSSWYRFYFKDRRNYLYHTRKIINILDKFEDIGYSLDGSTRALFVSTGKHINIKTYEWLSDTTDPLYDKCLIDYFSPDRFNANKVVRGYKKTLTGFTCTFYSKKKCMEFNVLSKEMIPDYQLNWYNSEEYGDKVYCVDIIMKDKVESDRHYTSMKEMFGMSERKPRTTKDKTSGLSELLKNYKPDKHEKELYESLMGFIQ
jgi:hypothetical protein